jgi:hypothetical protein
MIILVRDPRVEAEGLFSRSFLALQPPFDVIPVNHGEHIEILLAEPETDPNSVWRIVMAGQG